MTQPRNGPTHRDNASRNRAFLKRLKAHTGGIPGQKDSWRGPCQWSEGLNASGDRVGFQIGNADLVWLYIRSGDYQTSEARTAQMAMYSRMISERMGDQQLGQNVHRHNMAGRSVAVQRAWVRDDEDEWPDVARWVMEQFDQLREIIATAPDEVGGRR